MQGWDLCTIWNMIVKSRQGLKGGIGERRACKSSFMKLQWSYITRFLFLSFFFFQESRK